MKLVYPACLVPFENGEGYTVTVPDLPGCVTEGKTLADAILMAEDAASGWVLDELEDGNPIPPASRPNAVSVPKDGFVSLLALDMDSYAEKYGDKAVRKNLTIPAWLNTFAEKQNINFSKVLQDALTVLYQQVG
ncbi:type II toxin-antitoxin system HicB family antitoxin [Yanshouia hominis]|uniref:Type II toxin-antitoxin system HicB family antitoxin n=1 Tax=Yanshouia hominis TaxID=2763673 RepID=A0ABR7NHF7_9FIRM|nr:type II toxin-antitoxin system HicB family antitoxin [Yanshouia hominis]MBC8575837.1 type II toxin-antitoxin system HicB family antitoxin [Yanshouia hominis]DAY45632.1 MAG TPA: hypothetical protein [Caudoviricetes sp.]